MDDMITPNSGRNSSVEMIHIKVLIIQEDSAPGRLCIEPTSNDDLFFHYKFEYVQYIIILYNLCGIQNGRKEIR